MCGGVKEAEEMMLLYISYLSALMGTWCKAYGKRAPVVTYGEYARLRADVRTRIVLELRIQANGDLQKLVPQHRHRRLLVR